MQPNTEQVFMADVDKFQLCIQVDKAATIAIEALYELRAYLWTWKDYPKLISDDAFMSTLRDMREAGLEEFMNHQPLDELRKVVTGVGS